MRLAPSFDITSRASTELIKWARFAIEFSRHIATASRGSDKAAIVESIARNLCGQTTRLRCADRQTLRDWVHRFNVEGPEALRDHRGEGPKPRLTPAQLAELAQVVESGPDPKTDGVVRWRRVDLKAVIACRFGVAYHERSVGKLLKALGFSHISARPRHPKQDERIVAAFKRTSSKS